MNNQKKVNSYNDSRIWGCMKGTRNSKNNRTRRNRS